VSDLELLRAYEPVIRYTAGEQFYPLDAAAYVARCDLFSIVKGAKPELLVPAGELTLERLASATAPPGGSLYLRFVQRPMNSLELAAWQRRPGRVPFRAPGRLARVGLFARLVDAGFNASLMLRGTVPGGTAAAAAGAYEEIRAGDPRCVYYGRVVRRDGWIVLHYMYFYAMNDWRSTFFGANDHEADMEQAFVVLEDRGAAAPQPAWVGFAAHDYTGDDLRRRWDDPAIEKVGDHPVIHAGAGSHAAYFERGEYVTTIPLPASFAFSGLLDGLRRFWRDTLRQEDPGDLAHKFEQAISIPFVDYARGDGLAIGPGAEAEWTPILVDDEVPWVDGYRGLWGLDTQDRFAGERAPAGLKYTRTGTVRQSWNDPFGFLGVDKLVPPGRLPTAIRDRIGELEDERAQIRKTADEKAAEVRRIQLDAGMLALNGSLSQLQERTADESAAGERELTGLRARDAELVDEIGAARQTLERVEAGDFGDPRAHLHHDQRPQADADRRYGRIVETWSAVSVSLLLLLLIGLLYSGVVPGWAAFMIAIAGYVVVEAAFRRRLLSLGLAITVLLAIIGGILLAITYSTELVILAIAAVALLTLADNVRELRG
jgi:hypothetical protein